MADGTTAIGGGWSSGATVRTPQAIRATEALLAGGTVSAAPEFTLNLGINGALGVHGVTDAASGQRLLGLVKPVAKGGAHEVFAYEVARAMGVEHLFAATARMPGGHALIEFVPGKTFASLGISGAEDLERTLSAGYRAQGMGLEAATRQARIDRQLMQAFDLVIANRDRNLGNGLYDEATGRLTLIDHGKMASFRKGPVPPYNSPFARSADTVLVQRNAVKAHHLVDLVLDRQVVDVLARTDRGRIERAFAQLSDDVAHAVALGHNGVRPDGRWLPYIFGKLDEAARTGRLRFLK